MAGLEKDDGGGMGMDEGQAQHEGIICVSQTQFSSFCFKPMQNKIHMPMDYQW